MLTAVLILVILNTLFLLAALGTLTQKIDETNQRINQIWDNYLDDTIDLLLTDDEQNEQ
jgi:hypothetical protein